MSQQNLILIFSMVCIMSISSCSKHAEPEPFVITDQLKNELKSLSSTRIFFGHQSVGNNILDGLKQIQSQAGVHSLKVVDLGSSLGNANGILIHSPVGENTKPLTKCEDYKRIIDEQLAGKIDIALLKFCYIDFNEHTDVQPIFDQYKRVMNDLKSRHPDITFIHVTAPLRYSAKGLSIWAREILGRPNKSKLANIKRDEFNELLRKTFADEPIFDLADSESTYPDGSREFFKKDGNKYFSMVKAFTTDGGHLSNLGKEYVAADFIHSLAIANRKRNVTPVNTENLGP